MNKIIPHLWFTEKAEEAARFYCSLLPDSRVDSVQALPIDTPSGPAGSGQVVGSRLISPGVQRILWERHLRDPEFRDANLAIESRVRAALEVLFRALRADGRMRDVDVHAAAFVIHTSIEWVASRLVLGEADVSREDVVAAASDMIARFLFDG